MAWADVMIPIVRGLVFDLETPYTYSDARLTTLIVTAAALVVSTVDFGTSYTVDTANETIVPDPSADDDFVALVSLKAACIISQGEARDAARKAISVKDGPSFIDTKDRAKHLYELAKDVCEKYQKAEIAYKVGDGSIGRAIVSPYATGAMSDRGRRFS